MKSFSFNAFSSALIRTASLALTVAALSGFAAMQPVHAGSTTPVVTSRGSNTVFTAHQTAKISVVNYGNNYGNGNDGGTSNGDGAGTGGNSLATPEPSAVALLAIGAFGLGGLVLMRRRNAASI